MALVAVGAGLLGGCAPAPAVEEVEAPIISNKMPEMDQNDRGKQEISDTVKVGLQAPNFTIQDEKGKEWKLSDYKGKVVLLDFWGFWCPTCVDELPELREYNDALKGKDFVMIGMNTDNDIDGPELTKKLAESPVNWRQGIVTEDHELVKDYHVRTFPTKVLIDKTGKIVYVDNFIDQSVIEKYL